jgi:hypothetical protein
MSLKSENVELCGIVAAILLFDFNDISYVGRLWCPELIPDIEKFLPVCIFKMAANFSQCKVFI